MELKLVINDVKEKKSYSKKAETNPFTGSKIGDKVSGDSIGLNGYELEVTGGSDFSGCPMRKDMSGTGKRKALLSSGPCIHIKRDGMRTRKTVAGNTIHDKTAQINLKVVKYGSKPVPESLGIELKKEEKVSEEKKEAPNQ